MATAQPVSAGTASAGGRCCSSSASCSTSTSDPPHLGLDVEGGAREARGGRHAAAENERLRARRDALKRQSSLEREARRLGMVKAGERMYVVEGLPKPSR